MAIVVRIVLADGKTVTRKLPAVPSKLKVPAGAVVEVIDKATGRKIPLGDKDFASAKGRGDDAGDDHGPAFVEIEELAPCAPEVQASGLGAASEMKSLANASQYVPDLELLGLANAADDEGFGLFGAESSTLLFGLIGVAVVAGAVILISDDKDKTPPDAPVGLAYTGTSITGTAEAGSTVEVFDGATRLGSVVAGEDETFSFPVTLADGSHAITATATDKAGNASAASPALTVTVDLTAPAAPAGLDLAAADDDGTSSTDNVTSRSSSLTISGNAEADSTVTLRDGSTVVGTGTAGANGTFSIDVDLAAGSHSITATATDAAGNASAASDALPIEVVAPTTLVNTSIDGDGSTITLYFDRPLDESGAVDPEQFSVGQGRSVVVSDVLIAGNRISLLLAEPLAETGAVTVSFAPSGFGSPGGEAVQGFSDVAVSNRLDLVRSGAIQFSQSSGIALNGAEIAAFDPESDRIFVTGSDGLQVIRIDADLSMELLGTIAVGTNILTSVDVAGGIVAVAVVGEDKTDPGRVYFIDASAPVGTGSVLGSVEVGANPDMVTFTPDGTAVLVANEGELDEAGSDPAGSVSVIDLSGGVGAATVRTAGFDAFNSQLASLKDQGVRLFAGETGFETTTLAQDLEPEYIAVSADGQTAMVTLQENNAVAIIDIATATVTRIVPLGLKNFQGLLADFSDRDDGIALTTGNPVYGQFMPDAIASFTGGDGRTYFVIANEGDDRDDFLPEFLDGFEEATRVRDLMLDAVNFPDASDLQENGRLGRLNVSAAPGNSGDLDGDGDVDRLLAYGARSFSILDVDGNIVFDSGSHIEEFVALGGVFDEDTGEGLFDDGRSDNKGPEPEGITTGVFGDSVLAFVTLERGGGGVMVYDVTDPSNVEFVQYVRNLDDISPEGIVYVKAEDSPSGEALLIVASEVSETLTAFEITPADTYTLQLLHFADAEAKSLAVTTAPNLAALVDAFEDEYVNSITLAGGDNYIPGLFFTAQADSSIADLIGFSGAPRIDIAIHNAIGVEASTIGNHEFDRGTGVFASAIRSSGDYPGAMFPYLSANLDFSGDSSLLPLFTETLGTGLERAEALGGRIVPSAVIEENGELIGIVGATTQVLRSITSLGGVGVKGTDANDMALLASQLQPYIDDLIAQGVDKIILMSHLQQLELEQALAPLLEGVDIIVAAGSNTRLSDEDDVLVAFPGHAAESEGSYPVLTAGKDGAPTVIVNTDNEYTYLGRLVVEFDADGEILTDSLDEYMAVNGAYAATAENVAAAWGASVGSLPETAFADGTRGGEVLELVEAVNAVLEDQGSNVFGYSDVYLEGERAFVRSQETNLGNLTADANAFVARQALGLDADDVVVSFKNGGGIRAAIGSLTGTGSDVVLGPNEGGVVTELDVGATLAFNNGLVVFETTPQGLLNILNSPNVFQAGNGGFGQIGGIAVSYDPSAPAGSRVVDIALVDGNGNKTALVNDGEVVSDAPETITMVTLDFIAGNDGDGTQIAENGTNFRYIMADGTLSEEIAVVGAPTESSPANTVVDIDAFTGEALGEQEALALYLAEVYGTPELAFDMIDTPQSLDERIQNIAAREDTVLDDTVAALTFVAGFEVSLAASSFAFA